MIVAFRRHTLLPLDDCLYALQPRIPHLTRSSLHRCLQRHGISRLPEVEGEASLKRKFKSYPIGFFLIDIAEVRTAEGKLYMLVAIDRTSKFAFVELHRQAKQRTRRRLPPQAGRGRPLQDPHGADRQRHPLHDARRRGIGSTPDRRSPRSRRARPGPRFRVRPAPSSASSTA